MFNTRENTNNQYFFEDNTVKNHTTYCYRVLAEFALKTSSGNPFRKVESLPSDEVCLMLRRDIPLFVKASVDKTGSNDGEVSLGYKQTSVSDFDTTLLLPPLMLSASITDPMERAVILNWCRLRKNWLVVFKIDRYQLCP
ncbi:MAG: hypothetical protein IPK46_20660 [Saprospiraceae bacterium]|nr:hypothetical protein [Saprospiraceae bacterium]